MVDHDSLSCLAAIARRSNCSGCSRIDPVSYTHLDVYKRQGPQDVDFQKVYDEIHKEKKNATLDKENNYAVVPSQNTISFDVKEAPVSYTHLDVYKRQVL